MHVLLVGSPKKLPPALGELLALQDWSIDIAPDCESAAQMVRGESFDAVVLGDTDQPAECETPFLNLIDSRRIAALVFSEGNRRLDVSEGALIDVAARDVSKEDILHRLGTLTRVQSHVRRVELELEHMQRLGKRLNQHFREIDDEMRLAARLQRDFLPMGTEHIGPLKFASIYRPASWVSGDCFDIVKLDDRHVAFYIADAVGHGLAAGLLTMFVKRALVTHTDDGGVRTVLDPSQALKSLNNALTQHALPNCQFLTAAYCLLDTKTLELKLARAGHPYPLLFSESGKMTELKSSGGLLGLFPENEFPTHTVQLRPREKIILYTDGLECANERRALRDDIDPANAALGLFRAHANLPAAELVSRIEDRLNRIDGSLQPPDDVTVLVVEIEPSACGIERTPPKPVFAAL